MMRSLLRRLGQRKLQTSITVLGVSVGAAVFVLMGAMAADAWGIVDDLLDYYEDKVFVLNENEHNSLSSGSPSNPLTARMVADVRALDGVDQVVCATGLSVGDDEVLTGIPSMIIGGQTGTGSVREGFWGRWEIRDGRAFEETETGVAVAGADMLDDLDAGIGDTVTVRGRRIEIVGSIKRVGWPVLDQCLMVPVADAQAMLAEDVEESLPGVDPADMTLQAVVYPKPGVDASELARRITDEVEGVRVMDVGAMREFLENSSLIIIARSVLFAACLLALLAGAMPIVNTMSVSVADQTREIGVKRALGASAGRIVRDVLAEAALIGALGGALGVGVSVPAALAMNAAAAAESGVTQFALSWQIVSLAVVFSVTVGVIGGLYPAWRVSRMDPVDALAHE